MLELSKPYFLTSVTLKLNEEKPKNMRPAAALYQVIIFVKKLLAAAVL